MKLTEEILYLRMVQFGYVQAKEQTYLLIWTHDNISN
jgi:hypothetical protein